MNRRRPIVLEPKNPIQTRMHSSRMRTGCSLTVCCSPLPGGGGLPGSWGGVCLVPGGFSLVQGGFSLVWGGSPWSGGVLLGRGGFSLVWGGLPGPGGVCLVPGGSPWSRGVLRRPPLLTESQTRAKTSPWPQLRCGR